MADVAGSSSSPTRNDKPVIVRVKRKAFQSRLDAFWLEINDRPVKRPLIDFDKLSPSESQPKVEEVKTKKVFVQHIETLGNSEVEVEVLQSVLKQDQRPVRAKKEHEASSKNARFEQVWRKRKGTEEAHRDEILQDMCQFYDVVRVDDPETANKEKEQKMTEMEEHMMMSWFLPSLKDTVPVGASEIESEIDNYIRNGATTAAIDDYVYDLYALKSDTPMMPEDDLNPFPLVKVDFNDDDFYDGPDESENESFDSNGNLLTCVKPDLPSTTVDHQQPITFLQSEALPQVTGSTAELRRQAVTPTGASTSVIHGSNDIPLGAEHQVPSRIPKLTSYNDPLQNELERICKENEETIKLHEDAAHLKKMNLDSELEENIAKARSLYERKLKDAYAAFQQKKNELDKIYKKVQMQQKLADAIRSKCVEPSRYTWMQHGLPMSSSDPPVPHAPSSGPGSPAVASNPSNAVYGKPAQSNTALPPGPPTSTSASASHQYSANRRDEDPPLPDVSSELDSIDFSVFENGPKSAT